MKKGTRRILMLDEIRGFAIVCMVVHHMFYDIGFILGLEWGSRIFDILCVFQPLFWAAFILTSGICSRMSRSTVKRGLLVLAAGGVITMVTAVIMPMLHITGAEIYFGILSCLGSCMIITGIFMPLIEKSNEKIGMAVSAFLFFATYNIGKGVLLFGLVPLPDFLYRCNFLFPLGIAGKNFVSADYFPIIPWLFMFLFGAFFGQYAKEERLPAVMYKKHAPFLQAAGKNSLWVYLLHQPILYGIFYIIKIFL